MRKRAIRVPWWGKILAKVVLRRVPIPTKLWKRVGVFVHGRMDVAQYVCDVFDAHVTKAGLEGKLEGLTILELGPGDSVATAVLAASHGARALLVDDGDYASVGNEFYLALVDSLRERGLKPPDLAGAGTRREVLRRCGAVYCTNGLASLKSLESKSVDFFFSQAVLEHVRAGVFVETANELRRISKPGGIGSHQVDLRDHLDSGLNNLRFPEWLWESEFLASSGFYTNRIQHRRMCDIFAAAGFDVEVRGVWRWDALPIAKPSLDSSFRSLPDDELSVASFDMVLRSGW